MVVLRSGTGRLEGETGRDRLHGGEGVDVSVFDTRYAVEGEDDTVFDLRRNDGVQLIGFDEDEVRLVRDGRSVELYQDDVPVATIRNTKLAIVDSALEFV
ncbi:hypothetical protein [Limimaricola cinnabarinus]|uniref:Uncharacterized protein n=1 Tax=Limimaricola cinnabarinus TaxID=1125964 RepID=A0A2G1MD98_9RHOB|nr:hypothetical protein [Limimaricola cinnabarinus]PHP26698.1 hypothetical protein CJ301_15100 [Limimaricola cinnabarinus]